MVADEGPPTLFWVRRAHGTVSRRRYLPTVRGEA
jgi:hypothetical protein